VCVKQKAGDREKPLRKRGLRERRGRDSNPRYA